MASLGRMRALAAAAVLVATSGVVAAVDRQAEPRRTDVGTVGPPEDLALPPLDVEPSPTTVVPVEEGPAPSSTSTTPRPRRGAGSASASTSTTVASVPAAPTSSSIVEGDGVGPGPQHLRGRVLYLNDTPAPSSLWSRRPDGSDRRLEVACPPPLDAGKPDGWWPNAPFDISPDGRYVARTCPVIGSDLNGIGAHDVQFDFVIQDVDGMGSRVLWRFGASDRAWPDWSPDGTRLAVATAGGTVVMDADGTNRRTIKPLQPMAPWSTFSWSPDGTKLLASSMEVVDLATGAVSKPLYGAPWPDGATGASMTAFRWDDDGLWWSGRFERGNYGSAPINGIWRLDLRTNAITQVLDLPISTEFTAVQRTTDGFWGRNGMDNGLEHLRTDGTIVDVGDEAFHTSVAG